MEFLKEGWHFKTKKSDNRMYIITRRKQEMKSHGRFSQDYWERIRQVEEQYESTVAHANENASQKEDRRIRRRRHREARNQLLRRLVIDRGTVKILLCTHVTDGFCTLWTYSGETYTSFLMKDVFRPGFEYQRNISGNESGKRIMRVSEEYCSGCTMFQPRLKGKNFKFNWYLQMKVE
jgi:hypothetical protein